MFKSYKIERLNMSKFKIGDKVRITGDYDDFTDHLDGKIGEVISVREHDIAVTVEGNPIPWLIWNYNAELVEDKVEDETPKYKIGDLVVVEESNVDFLFGSLKGETGVIVETKQTWSGHDYRVKMDDDGCKLWCKVKGLIEEPKYYNGKVVCVDLNDSNEDNYTVGKIYEFKDGRMTSDCGHTFGKYREFHSFEDWERFSSSKFIEVVE